MPLNATPIQRIIALTLIVAGIGLIISGFQLSDSIESSVNMVFTSAETDRVTYNYIGGAASLVVGVYLFFKK